ncbi:hypothetical protein J6590_038111 [Homalodisca vitripennis]|nr:hypothetical protein J6590_038111 [Homalodisca vitripennis]
MHRPIYLIFIAIQPIRFFLPTQMSQSQPTPVHSSSQFFEKRCTRQHTYARICETRSKDCRDRGHTPRLPCSWRETNFRIRSAGEVAERLKDTIACRNFCLSLCSLCVHRFTQIGRPAYRAVTGDPGPGG